MEGPSTTASSPRTTRAFGDGGNQTYSQYGATSADVTSVVRDTFSFVGTLVALFWLSDIQDMVDDQIELIRGYYGVFKADNDFFKERYMPLMRGYVEEEFGINVSGQNARPLYQPNFNNRTQAFKASANRIPDLQFKRAVNMTSRFNTGAIRYLSMDSEINRMQNITSSLDLARRMELSRLEQFANQRWARRLALLNIGVDGANQANAGLASAIDAYTSASNNYADAKTSIASGATRVLGFMGGKSEKREEA